jgi:hypothetical protein
MRWSEHQIEEAIRLHAEGARYRYIAKAIGKSKNAISGMIHRLGLAVRWCDYRRIEVLRERELEDRQKRNPRRYVPKLAISGDGITSLQPSSDDPPEHERVPFLEARLGQCRWIFDDGTVCGRKVAVKSTYCDGHHRRAYVLPKTRNGMHAA